ncbi:hypothetical protein DL95DRAFT_450820 [Leptodontidium sp. 2 PMI_412]|nr:hypothetical protein DL95DRAFT_450820 [Leptodontidium sp. 2 PMI_412]
MEAIITTSTDLQLQAVSIDSEVGEQEQMTSARAIANQSFDFSGLNTPDSLIVTPASTVFLAIDSLDNEQLEQIESNTSSTASVVNEKDEEGANHRDMGEQEGVSERDEAEKEGSGHKEEEADDEEVETAVIDADPGTFASVSRALALAEMYRLARLLNVEIIEPPSGRGDTSLFIAKLPLEIRQMVYELLLVNPILGGIASISKYQDYGANSKYDLYPAILGVNRQVWEEASHTLYTVNNFFMVFRQLLRIIPYPPRSEHNDLWYYKRSTPSFGPDGLDARFGSVESILNRPSLLKAQGLSFSDVSGRGQPDIVQMSSPVKGSYRLSDRSDTALSETWSPLRTFTKFPSGIDLENPKVMQFDFTGNGLADLILFENETIAWYECLGDDGFSEAKFLSLPQDDHNSPKMVFRDPQQSIFLGDLSGDGLVDFIHMRNGDVSYWPNLGAQFGAKVVMDNSPIMDVDGNFSTARLLLGNLDGSGTADLIYLRDTELHIYLSQAGNSWSPVVRIPSVPAINQLSFVASVDILGSDFTNGLKPHLMSKITNNMGKEIILHYKPSTAFYLTDKAEGKPWITKLPFPTQCLEKVETTDLVSQSRYSERRAYHHRYYDTFEREFRGFGSVEQWDVDELPQVDDGSNSYSLPAVHTRRWYHTGPFTGNKSLSEKFSREYYSVNKLLLDILPEVDSIGNQEALEASRCLKGMLLREEIYTDDASSKSGMLYKVTDYGNTVVSLQPLGQNMNSVLFPFAREVVTYYCERDLSDPLISHTMVLEKDDFGNTMKSVAIFYGRAPENQFTNNINSIDVFRTPLPCSSNSYEIVGLKPSAGNLPLGVKDFLSPAAKLVDMPQFRSDNLERLLNFGVLDPMGILGAVYTLAYTSKHLDSYKSIDNRALQTVLSNLGSLGGYVTVDETADLYTLEPKVHFSADSTDHARSELLAARNNFYQPQSSTDSFGNTHVFNYDSHRLHVIQIIDPFGSATESSISYRLMVPEETVDLNRSHTKVCYDALGLLVAVARMGKVSEAEPEADSLEGVQRNLAQAQVDSYMANPLDEAATLLSGATERFVYDYRPIATRGALSPTCISALKRETHGIGNDKIQISFSLDNLSRTIKSKVFAGPDPETAMSRWVCSGWVVLNDKGFPVQSFEPFFDSSHSFQFNKRVGVASYTVYDALGRKVSVLHPTKHWTKSIIHPWKLEGWDPIDTLLLDPSKDEDIGHVVSALSNDIYSPTWYDARIDGSLGQREQIAAQKSAKLSGTPVSVHFDALGASFMQENSIGAGLTQQTRTLTDIQGRLIETFDGRGSVVVRTSYDMPNRPVHTQTMDAGNVWQVHDSNGLPIASIDNKNRLVVKTYDALRRETDSSLYDAEQSAVVVNRVVYGETTGSPEEQIQHNSRGKAVRTYDQSGVITIESYDFEGNALSTGSNVPPELELQTYRSTASYDALGRITSCTEPDKTVNRSTFNAMGLLDTVTVNLYGALDSGGIPLWTSLINSTSYDAAGKKISSTMGNGARTTNTYTFTRKNSSGGLQTQSQGASRDNAQQEIFFRDTKIGPQVDYEYDQLYRLVKATGREHLGQTLGIASGPGQNEMSPNQGLDVAADGKAIGQYTESFAWTRTYSYTEPSQINPSQIGNKLSSTTVGRVTDAYQYDSSGLTTSMPHLSNMKWNFQNRLTCTSQQKVSNGDIPETTWYVYNTAGERIRKVTERHTKAGEPPRKLEERITIGTTEIFYGYQGDDESTRLQCMSQKVLDGSGKMLVLFENWTGSDDAPGLLFRYSLANTVESVSVELDETGLVISYEEYSPYGTSTYRLLLSKVPKRFRFSGKEQDTSKSMYYFGLRYYAAWLGKWISADPTGIADSLNVFEYARSNPVSNHDPDGAELEHHSPEMVELDEEKIDWENLSRHNPPPEIRQMDGRAYTVVGRLAQIQYAAGARSEGTNDEIYQSHITKGNAIMADIRASARNNYVPERERLRDERSNKFLVLDIAPGTVVDGEFMQSKLTNQYDMERGIIKADSNYQALGDTSRVNWNEAVFYNFKALSESLGKPLDLNAVERSNIYNEETRVTIARVESLAGDATANTRSLDRTWRATGGSRLETDGFLALLGTPNGQGAVRLLSDFNSQLSEQKTITAITVHGISLPQDMTIHFGPAPPPRRQNGCCVIM